jgi:amidophosphoribosyltransferase
VKSTCVYPVHLSHISCFYGINTPDKDELLASQHELEAMRKIIGVDSLTFISFDGLYRAVGGENRNTKNPQYCDACFSGNYPIRLLDQDSGEAPRQLSLLTTQE